MELAPGVRHAALFRDAIRELGLVARIIVGHQLAAPIFQERPAVLAGPAGREVVEHYYTQAVVRVRCVRPQVSPMCLGRARLEHLHRRLVGVCCRAHVIAPNRTLISHKPSIYVREKIRLCASIC